MSTSRFALVVLLGVAGCAPYQVDDREEGGRGTRSSLSVATQPLDPASAAQNYAPYWAAYYADLTWNDGLGLCAEFVSNALVSGGFSMDTYTWVPDLVAALWYFPYDEYYPPDPTYVGGDVGDVVIYSNDGRDAFCQRENGDERSCGHVGIITVAGVGPQDTLADFHNVARYQMPIGDVLDSTALGQWEHVYSVYRVIHLAQVAAQVQQGYWGQQQPQGYY